MPVIFSCLSSKLTAAESIILRTTTEENKVLIMESVAKIRRMVLHDGKSIRCVQGCRGIQSQNM